jgi:hypothetical protein
MSNLALNNLMNNESWFYVVEKRWEGFKSNQYSKIYIIIITNNNKNKDKDKNRKNSIDEFTGPGGGR